MRKFKIAYFGASCDTPAYNKEFAEELDLDYPLLSDPDRKTAIAYGVVNEKRKFPNRWTYIIGPNGKILHIDKKVKVTTHAEDIAAKLKELGVATN